MKKRDRLTHALKRVKSTENVCILTSTPSAQAVKTDNYTLRWTARPRLYLKSLRTFFFCKQSQLVSSRFILFKIGLVCVVWFCGFCLPVDVHEPLSLIGCFATREVSITCLSYCVMADGYGGWEGCKETL